MGFGASEGSELRAVERRLRHLGLRPPKTNSPPPPPPPNENRVFGVNMQFVARKKLTCCGEELKIPVIVYDACHALRSRLSTEGLFRKAGSQNRQKDIKKILDSGGKIDKSWHAIDVANILKSYLRVLPEPLISYNVQELLIRCLLLPNESRLHAVQLCLLLMSNSHLQTLHYIMEFLKCVALQSDLNKMDTNNLAIVIAPTIMPPPLTCPPQRVQHHVTLIKILIENASIIGKVPAEILSSATKEEDDDNNVKKSKKRRSGSLTRMFTGLRKMVTSASNKLPNPEVIGTPIIDKGLKKKHTEVHGFSAKKRKEILESLPQKHGDTAVLLPRSESRKRLRLSISKKSKDKFLFNDNISTRKSIESQHIFNSEEVFNLEENIELKSSECVFKNVESDYVKIPKSEYEAIKDRVSAIESRISQEFSALTSIDNKVAANVEDVQSAYKKTLEEAAILSSPSSDQLARRLSRELKIRQSDENKIIRSPSARKIGTIRRRSRENSTKLVRTNTWTVSSNNKCMSKDEKFYNTINLRRGRPNTINSGLIHPNLITNSNNNLVTQLERRHSEDHFVSLDSNNVLKNSILENRPTRTSFHGCDDVKKYIKNFKNDGINWKSAESVMSDINNFNNQITGRASVARLRSQMAGTVLAKAKLFDDMTNSDTSDKNINEHITKRASFARKSRKSNFENQNNNSLNDNIPFVNSRRAIKNIRSPGFVSKRHKPKSGKSVINNEKCEDNSDTSTKLKSVALTMHSPAKMKYDKKYPHIQERFIIKKHNKTEDDLKSPRNTAQTKKSFSALEIKKINTPTRTNCNTPRRQSPRIVSLKNRQLI